MDGRLSRVRRGAFLVAFLVSAAVYAYSVAGIMGTGGELRSIVSAESAERSVPVLYREPSGTHEDCPYRPYVPRVEL